MRVVVTNVDTAFGESSEGVVGSLTLQPLDPLPEGAPCAESDAFGPAVCGPGARCVDGRCAVIATPPRCHPAQSTRANGTVCNAAGRCAPGRAVCLP